jgi:processive 1,2-diacylglycerol beta-glucosyltransferase
MHEFRKVLILSASYGEGHQQAARAIQEALLTQNRCLDVRIIDYLQMVHPILNSITRYCYIQSVKLVPSLYGILYHGSRNMKPSSILSKQLNQLGSDELVKYLNQYEPDIVISTFPTPAGVMSALKERGVTNVPAATVITDHAIHNQWIHPYTDMYFVGSQHVRKELIQRGVPENKISVTGIPIRGIFNQPMDREALQRKYHIKPDVPTVLVMGGAYGVLHDIPNICEELFTFPRRVQVLVVCGHNEKLYMQIKEISKRASNPVQVFGYVQDIHELMAISDLVITKAGGLTISESLAMELPMLLYRPIPGQEIQNAKFLVKSRVAVLAETRKHVSKYVKMLLSERPELLLTMRENTKKIKKPNAAEDIAQITHSIAVNHTSHAYPHRQMRYVETLTN